MQSFPIAYDFPKAHTCYGDCITVILSTCVFLFNCLEKQIALQEGKSGKRALVNCNQCVKKPKEWKKLLCTHIDALPNSSPKGQWGLDHLMQMVHSQNTVNLLYYTCARISYVYWLCLHLWHLYPKKLSPSFQLSDPFSSWWEKSKRLGRGDACCPSSKRYLLNYWAIQGI